MISIHAPNNSAPKQMKQKLIELRVATDNSTLIVGDFNILLTIMDRKTRQVINKDKKALNNVICKQDLTDIHKHSTQKKKNTYSSKEHTK